MSEDEDVIGDVASHALISHGRTTKPTVSPSSSTSSSSSSYGAHPADDSSSSNNNNNGGGSSSDNGNNSSSTSGKKRKSRELQGLEVQMKDPYRWSSFNGTPGSVSGKNKKLKKKLARKVPSCSCTSASIPAPHIYIPGVTEQIFVKSVTGKITTINVDLSNATVRDVKAQMYAIEGIPCCQQRIDYAGRQLVDDVMLSTATIVKESTLHLILRLRGRSKL